MPEDLPTNGELMRQIQLLRQENSDGFSRVGKAQEIVAEAGRINTEFRLKAEGSLSIFKWLFGFLGAGNVALIIKLFFIR